MGMWGYVLAYFAGVVSTLLVIAILLWLTPDEDERPPKRHFYDPLS